MERVRVEDLPSAVSISASSVSLGTCVVAVNVMRWIDRVLDHAERDRDAVGTLPDQRRHLVGEVAEIEDRLQVLAHRASSNGSPTFVLTTARMRSVGTCAFPETETLTIRCVSAATIAFSASATRGPGAIESARLTSALSATNGDARCEVLGTYRWRLPSA